MKATRFLANRDVWFAFALIVLSTVSIWLFSTNRALINDQRRDLEKICNTTTTLDIALVVPLLVETNQALEDLPAGDYKQRILVFRNNLRTAHGALSETQSCESVR
jgi:hypothetical protein